MTSPVGCRSRLSLETTSPLPKESALGYIHARTCPPLRFCLFVYLSNNLIFVTHTILSTFGWAVLNEDGQQGRARLCCRWWPGNEAICQKEAGAKAVTWDKVVSWTDDGGGKAGM